MNGRGVRPLTMGPVEWMLLVTLSVLWGAAFFFIDVAVPAVPPLTLVATRIFLGAMVLWLVVRVAGSTVPRDRVFWRDVAIFGLFNSVIPFTLISWAQISISGALASILVATTPLWGVVIAHVSTLDEKASAARFLGAGLGIIGVAMVIGPGALLNLEGETLAACVVVLAAVSYAATGVFGRRMRGREPLMVAAGQLSMASCMVVPLALLVDRPWTLPMPGVEALGAVAGLTLLSTALAYIVYFSLLARAGATNLLLVNFIIPVTAVLLGVLVLGDVLAPRHLMGMAVIALGLALIDGRLPRAVLRRFRGARR